MMTAATPKKPNLIAVDPSITNLGYAMMKPDGTLVDAGFLKQDTPRTVDYHIRAFAMGQTLAQLVTGMTDLEPADILIEAPTNWFNQRGIASKDDEGIQKLYYQVGCAIGLLSTIPSVAGIWTVAPIQWKGNLTKDVMMNRCARFAAQQHIFLRQGIPHDTCEAILLARYGLLHRVGDTAEYTEPIVPVYGKSKPTTGMFQSESFIDSAETGAITED